MIPDKVRHVLEMHRESITNARVVDVMLESCCDCPEDDTRLNSFSSKIPRRRYHYSRRKVSVFILL